MCLENASKAHEISKAAVSVTDGMAAGAIGTDTGGSIRIPSALNGLVGFKPTAKRVPLDDVLPLSFTLDSAGPIAKTVADCALLNQVLAAEPGGIDVIESFARVRDGGLVALPDSTTQIHRASSRQTNGARPTAAATQVDPRPPAWQRIGPRQFTSL